MVIPHSPVSTGGVLCCVVAVLFNGIVFRDNGVRFYPIMSHPLTLMSKLPVMRACPCMMICASVPLVTSSVVSVPPQPGVMCRGWGCGCNRE